MGEMTTKSAGRCFYKKHMSLLPVHDTPEGRSEANASGCVGRLSFQVENQVNDTEEHTDQLEV
jgi:hypothetical protein